LKIRSSVIAVGASVLESPKPSLLGSEISLREGWRGVVGPAEFVGVVAVAFDFTAETPSQARIACSTVSQRIILGAIFDLNGRTTLQALNEPRDPTLASFATKR
jgi:hypothetical protein